MNMPKTSLYKNLLAKVNGNEITAGIIGLGYVGLPLLTCISRHGLKAVGYDIDGEKIIRLRSADSYLETVKSEDIASGIKQNLLSFTDDIADLARCDFLILCVPTPLDQNNDPDLSYVTNTAEALISVLRAGHVVSLESTTYPGTLHDVVQPILEKSGLKEGRDFYLVYSPEREDPGNASFHTNTIPKIVGADTPEALEIAKGYYSLFIADVITVKDSRTAEAVKITENIFRAVNIALVNELKVIFDRMDIDVWEVIEAAKTKPFGYMPFYPGPGLGGHCIPIDPFYLAWKAREYGLPARFIELAGEINHAMPDYVFEKTRMALRESGKKSLESTRVLIVGIAYKKNVNDQRETPAFPLINKFRDAGCMVSFYDPHINEIMPARHYPDLAGLEGVELDSKTLEIQDAVIVVTDHDATDYKKIAEHAKLIVDTRNAFADYKKDIRGHYVKA